MNIGIPCALVTPAKTIPFNGFAFDGTDFSGAGFAGDYYRLSELGGLDFPTLRTTQDPVPQGDGGIIYDSWLGPRFPILRGVIKPDETTEAAFEAQRAQMQADLAAALLSIVRADGALVWAPRGVVGSPDPEEVTRQLTVRAWEPLQIGGGPILKDFHIGLAAADPRIVSTVEQTVTDTAAAWSVTVTNDGDTDAAGTISVTGSATPLTAFTIDGPGTGQLVFSGLDLNGSSTVTVDLATRSVSPVSALAGLDFGASEWFLFPPGSTAITLSGLSGTPSELEAIWRDSWAAGS